MKIDNPNHLTPIRKNDRYFNSPHDRIESLIFDTIPSFFRSLYGRKKRQPENKFDWIASEAPLASSHEPVITWIGHATFLIQTGGLNILTDPIFGNASHFFPRLLPPGLQIEQLPPIDLVLLSHNHRDHCDLASLAGLQKRNPQMHLLVAAGDKKWLSKKGFPRIDEFEWWQNYSKDSVTLTFLPAHHWSAQGVFDRNLSLWGSWMIQSDSTPARPAVPAEVVCFESPAPRLRRPGEPFTLEQSREISTNGKGEGWELVEPFERLLPFHGEEDSKSLSRTTIYFAGDTSYAPHFTQIAQEFPKIDVALMPIAPEFPHPSMRKSHIDSHEAVQSFIDLKAGTFVPMHWGTFPFGTDTFLGPIERLQKAWVAHELHTHKNLIVPKVGQRITLA